MFRKMHQTLRNALAFAVCCEKLIGRPEAGGPVIGFRAIRVFVAKYPPGALAARNSTSPLEAKAASRSFGRADRLRAARRERGVAEHGDWRPGGAVTQAGRGGAGPPRYPRRQPAGPR